MAEYYTVLKRAIAGIDPNVAEARRAVYDKARNALIGQLKAVDPPLTTAEISRQRLELEEAIRRVERESAGIGAPPPVPPQPQHLPAEPPPRRAAPQPHEPAMAARSATPAPAAYQESGRAAPQDAFRRAIQQAGIRGANREPVAREPVSARAEAARHSATAPDLRQPDDRAMRQDERPARREQGYRAPPPPDDRYRAPPPPDDRYRAPPPPSSDLYEPEPRLAPEYDQEWDPAPPATGRASGPPPPQLDEHDRLAFAKKGRRRGYVEDDGAELLDKPARRSRLPGLILLVLIIGVVGGLAALGWSQRTMLNDLLASFESNEPPTLSEQPSDAAEPASTKNSDRLLAGNNAKPEPAAKAAPVRVVDEADGNTEMAAASAGDAGAEPLPVSTGDAASSAAPAPQKAILYEEPVGDSSNGGVTAINAAVTWQYNKDGPNGPEIEAELEVPERKMTVRFSLHKNSDDTLPASHLIEVTVDTPADFPGKGIDEIPRIVFKPSEEARGQPLVGAAAKVADGFFWIALSANQNDIASNLDLLRGREWIDLPFVYGNGQRAILTFEKGPQGDKVFADALAAWGAG